jgi:hypothetical protein
MEGFGGKYDTFLAHFELYVPLTIKHQVLQL